MIPKRSVIEAGLVVGFSVFAFHGRQKKEARKRSQGICQDCGENMGKGKTIFGHLNHDHTLATYNSIENNGRERCKLCETSYHLAHIQKPDLIGLTKRDNLTATFGHLADLPEEDQLKLAATFPEEFRYLMDRVSR